MVNPDVARPSKPAWVAFSGRRRKSRLNFKGGGDFSTPHPPSSGLELREDVSRHSPQQTDYKRRVRHDAARQLRSNFDPRTSPTRRRRLGIARRRLWGGWLRPRALARSMSPLRSFGRIYRVRGGPRDGRRLTAEAARPWRGHWRQPRPSNRNVARQGRGDGRAGEDGT